jgi:divalent metal cation (Fe/Co/Zn/Cd) transporter
MHMGPEFILVNLSVDFKDGISSEQVEQVIANVDRTIKQAHPRVQRIFIEAESRWQQFENRIPPGN